MKYYNRDNIGNARELRKNMTPWERKLWYQFLKNHSMRFQRQKLLGNYIVDFYCAKAKLAIELDGSGHYDEEQIQRDEIRTKNIEATGIKVFRVSNLDVDKNFRGVCEAIDMLITSPPRGGGTASKSRDGGVEILRKREARK